MHVRVHVCAWARNRKRTENPIQPLHLQPGLGLPYSHLSVREQLKVSSLVAHSSLPEKWGRIIFVDANVALLIFLATSTCSKPVK